MFLLCSNEHKANIYSNGTYFFPAPVSYRSEYQHSQAQLHFAGSVTKCGEPKMDNINAKQVKRQGTTELICQWVDWEP